MEGQDPSIRKRVSVIVREYVAAHIAGNGRPIAELVAAHPDLAPNLANALEEISPILGLNYERPSKTHTPSNVASTIGNQGRAKKAHVTDSGLTIRCPHCHEIVELDTNANFSDITCSTCGSSFSLVDRATMTYAAQPLKSIAHLELVSRLGKGSFGEVWKAYDTKLDRTVAVKIPRHQLDADQEEQFLREARAAAQLKHPNIVSVHEIGRDDETLFIVSDFVRGVTLSDWLTVRQPSFRETAELCAKIADALHHAHERGVVHRDLKPSNIMLDESNTPHVMDFGLAKRDAGEVTMTLDGQVLGTAAYMPPEQASGESHQSDRRADIYSLGCVLFELLTGGTPFRGNARMQIHQALNDEAPSPRKLNSNVPRDLENICLKCLRKERERRYPTADVLAQEIRRFLNGEPLQQTRPVGRVERAWLWARRNPWVAGLTSAVALLLCTIAVVLVVMNARLALEKESVEKSRDEAIAAEKDAMAARDEATVARDEAIAARNRADEALAQEAIARQANLSSLRDVVLAVDPILRQDRSLSPLRLRVMEIAQKRLLELRKSIKKDAILDRTEAGAWQRMGDIHMNVNRITDAKTCFETAYDILLASQQAPLSAVDLMNLKSLHFKIGKAQFRLGDAVKARDEFTVGLDHLTKWREFLDGFIESKRFEPNVEVDQVINRIWLPFGTAYQDLADVNQALGQPTEALRHYVKAESFLENLTSQEKRMFRLSSLHLDLANAHRYVGRQDVADRKLRETHETLLKRLEETNEPATRRTVEQNLAKSYLFKGHFSLCCEKNAQEAAEHYRKSLELYESFFDQNDIESWGRMVGRGHYYLGTALIEIEDDVPTNDDATKDSSENDSAETVAADSGEPTVATVGTTVGTTVIATARQHFEASREHFRILSKVDSNDTQPAIHFALSLARCGETKEAAKIADALLAGVGSDPRIQFQAACILSICSLTEPDEQTSLAFTNRSLELLEQLVQNGWKNHVLFQQDPDLKPVRKHVRFDSILKRIID